jgi:hypothetical protein
MRAVEYTEYTTFLANGPGEFQAAYVDGTITTGDYSLDSFGIGGIELSDMQVCRVRLSVIY